MPTEMNRDTALGLTAADSSSDHAVYLSQQVFKDADDFLQTLSKDIAKIPHGDHGVTITELKEFASDVANPKEKAAADIAIKHFDQLSNLRNRGSSNTETANGFIWEKDIDFAESMNKGDLTTPVIKEAKLDIFPTAFGLTVAGIGGGCAAMSVAEGLTVAGIAGGVTFGGLAIAGVAMVGVIGYEAATMHGRLGKMSADEQKEFKSWINP